jgi:hypothetical protein
MTTSIITKVSAYMTLSLIAIYVSSIISTRLLIMLKEHGIKEQLGCQPLRG